MIGSVKKFVHELQFLRGEGERDGQLGNSRKKNIRGGCMGFLGAGLLKKYLASAISRD